MFSFSGEGGVVAEIFRARFGGGGGVVAEFIAAVTLTYPKFVLFKHVLCFARIMSTLCPNVCRQTAPLPPPSRTLVYVRSHIPCRQIRELEMTHTE